MIISVPEPVSSISQTADVPLRFVQVNVLCPFRVAKDKAGSTLFRRISAPIIWAGTPLIFGGDNFPIPFDWKSKMTFMQTDFLFVA